MDIMGMMGKAKQLQAKLEELQAEMDRTEVDGEAGGGLVTCRATAKGEMRALSIDASLLKPEEKEVVEDLVMAALADARRKAEAVMAEKMSGLAGGLPLPPGMKLF
ncbi:YbaB/EbfC family nucleoid-associated protein [Blastochloris sulfoviridis]|uniref:Nucleoid-associated protein F1193_02000 n=1 Tax=Blastochloris sulfoviridis TaxID=50712 RepID=A0A5M6I5D7_9HYPH|nr:YbaB/EbfC family nucleoid-associated protein [Blastochloris sulfoviridis]KAA5603441.1 YbaB/EbfC family nucleoid-associated protein [Blastochloris sulfoviridis]